MAIRQADVPGVEKLYYTPVEVAKILSLARATAYEYIKKGEIPSIRVGERVRIPCDLFERWLEEKEAAARDHQTYGSKARIGQETG